MEYGIRRRMNQQKRDFHPGHKIRTLVGRNVDDKDNFRPHTSLEKLRMAAVASMIDPVSFNLLARPERKDFVVQQDYSRKFGQNCYEKAIDLQTALQFDCQAYTGRLIMHEARERLMEVERNGLNAEVLNDYYESPTSLLPEITHRLWLSHIPMLGGDVSYQNRVESVGGEATHWLLLNVERPLLNGQPPRTM